MRDTVLGLYYYMISHEQVAIMLSYTQRVILSAEAAGTTIFSSEVRDGQMSPVYFRNKYKNTYYLNLFSHKSIGDRNRYNAVIDGVGS